jgi:hypothetical protein
MLFITVQKKFFMDSLDLPVKIIKKLDEESEILAYYVIDLF